MQKVKNNTLLEALKRKLPSSSNEIIPHATPTNNSNGKVHLFRESDPIYVNGAHINSVVGTRLDQRATNNRDSSIGEVNLELQLGPPIGQNVPKGNAAAKKGPIIDSGNPKRGSFAPRIVDCFGFGTFEEFLVVIDDLIKNCDDIPDHIKRSYYQLCSSQKTLLHAGVSKGSSPVMIAECIIETVNIATAMKSCNLPTFQTENATWDEKLRSLTASGMNVTFLCARLHHLQQIACNQEVAKSRQLYKDLSSELAEYAHKIQNLKDKVEEIKGDSKRRILDLRNLQKVIEKQDLMFQQEQISAPW